MPYCRLYYHLVWGTKGRQPLLTANVALAIYDYLRSKAIGLGATVYALNGVEDHIHMVVTIPPTVAVATFVGQVKGVSSSSYNKLFQAYPTAERPVAFAWQAEYGAFSFDSKRLPPIIDYVEAQQTHHAQGTTIPVLECYIPQPASSSAVREIREVQHSYNGEHAEPAHSLDDLLGIDLTHHDEHRPPS